MPNRESRTAHRVLPTGRDLIHALCVALSAAVVALLAGAGVAVAQPADPCPPGAPIAVCDPATGQTGTGGATGSPAPEENGPEGCFPGSVDPACRTTSDGTATTPQHPACTGLSCIPQTRAEPGTTVAPPAGPGAAPPAAAQCGIFNLNACIDEFFRWIVGSALNPLLDLVSGTLLTTPTVESLPRVAQMWDTSWQVLLACYALLVLVAGVVLMAYGTLQTHYTIKEIAPRLVVGFLAGALSLWVAARGIDLANGLSAAVAGDDVDAASAGATLRAITQNSLTGGITIVLMGLVLVVMVVVLLLTYIVRVALTVLLVAGAPLALMFHALPQTEGIARWWWKAFAATLAIQVGQSLALITSIKVFLAPGGLDLFGNPTSSGLINILVAIALVYVLIKIPFWMLSTIRGGGGRSMVGSLARGFIAYKTFGLLGGRRSGGRRAARATRQGDTSSDDPYANVRATRDGQYMLPLGKLSRRPRPAPSVAMPSTASRGRHPDQGRQLALPLGDDWPENKPVLGRDGQYRLPLDVRRRPRPAPVPEPPRPRRIGPRPVQLKLDLFDSSTSTPARTRTPDPYAGTRPDSAGQYPIPLGVRRVPKPAPQPATPVPASPQRPPGPRPRQLHLPLDLPLPRRQPATPPIPPPPPAPGRPQQSRPRKRT